MRSQRAIGGEKHIGWLAVEQLASLRTRTPPPQRPPIERTKELHPHQHQSQRTDKPLSGIAAGQVPGPIPQIMHRASVSRHRFIAFPYGNHRYRMTGFAEIAGESVDAKRCDLNIRREKRTDDQYVHTKTIYS